MGREITSFILFFTVLTFVVLTISSQSAVAAELPNVTYKLCTLPENIQRTRPDQNGSPTKVKVALILLDLIDINETKESIDVDFVLALQWQDARLSKHARGSSLENCRVRLNSIWNPDIFVVNGQAQNFHLDSGRDVDIDEYGVVRVQKRMTGALTSPMKLRDFPLDDQRVKILISSFEYSSKDVSFIIDKATTAAAGKVHTEAPTGWKILSVTNEVLPDATLEGWGSYARMQNIIVVQRLFGYWFWKLVLPITLIVLMAWSVFWLDPEVFTPQITIAATSVFTLIAFQLSLKATLPQIEYLTRADQMIVGSTVLVFIALGQAVVTSRLVQHGRLELARRADVYGRWIYLSIYLGMILIFLIWH